MQKNDSVSIVQNTMDLYADDPKKLTAELKRLIKDGQRSRDLLMMGAAYCHLAELCHYEDDDHGAFSNALKAITILKDTKAYELLVLSYLSLGLVYSNQDNPQTAMEIDETAFLLVRKHRIRGPVRIKVLNALAANYTMLGDFQKSIRLLTECLSLIEESPEEDLIGKAKVTLNLSAYYEDNNEPVRSREILMTMAPWIDKVGFPALHCDYYLRLSAVSYLLNDQKQGEAFADTAFDLIPKDRCPMPVCYDLKDLLQHMLIRKDRVRAGRIFEVMKTLAENENSTIQQVYIYRTMADYQRVFGKPEQAVACYEKLMEILDKQKEENREIQCKQVKRLKAADSEIRKLNREIRKNEEMVSLEPMTKLMNRRGLLRVSSEFIDDASKKGGKVGAIFIDIDFFKECNDTYGHTRGDEIIRKVADACRMEETKNVRFSRYGGDEFFGITCGLTDEKVCNIARRIAKTIRDADLPHVNNPNGGRITLSIGVVNMTVNDRTNTILDIANNADKALYYAKKAGKNVICQQVSDDPDAGERTVNYVKIPL
ncbi:MAG: GGDEF domain-containing protein [Lachnospiraceae bacterium]|nr:GGDEF domain-containing protein [Lachnospiraceae bacterium]